MKLPHHAFSSYLLSTYSFSGVDSCTTILQYRFVNHNQILARFFKFWGKPIWKSWKPIACTKPAPKLPYILTLHLYICLSKKLATKVFNCFRNKPLFRLHMLLQLKCTWSEAQWPKLTVIFDCHLMPTAVPSPSISTCNHRPILFLFCLSTGAEFG